MRRMPDAPDRVTSSAPGSRPYTPSEELAHWLTHGIGALISVAGLVPLLIAASRHEGSMALLSAWLYGLSLVVLYGASTAYHAVGPGRLQRVLHTLDHAAIYLLIAGTYTPFLLVTFADGFGPPMALGMWIAAGCGVVFKLFATGRFERLSLAIYLLMGWAVLFVAPPVFRTLPAPALWLLVGGGLAYTLGVAFYVWERLHHHHTVWHLFVLAGSLLHYFAILLYVY